ncbi:hypothetical protein [Amycolatopsis sp. Hca4]|uniref:hypothetical protein n=1 Tax=Amycolatopsis sp. Hca4 TaxID=2742131 RepID=UPI00158FCDB6|nr:hypothetical protein [Amycolatopsis sp. Hca4]QKV73420.1 hypothetical protein HUT10_06205 [Amycolatopsis sp. Hca4]
MTYHLAGLRLHSVGERSARFTDLSLDFTAPEDEAPAPADSVVWLRNGGGKSSLLSLFYALLLPNANDFLGRVAKRSLTDYVDTGDTAHTIAIWHPAAVSGTLDGAAEHVLITGAVYEWADLRRPADADRARDKLNVSFYAFYAVPGVLEPGSLPISDESGSPLRQNAFLAAVREAAAAYPQAADLVITSRQHEWTTALVNRGLDPELFRTQKQMNHVEGGVEDMFKFASARQFIDLLIDLTAAPEDAENVAQRLSSIASLLQTKPAKKAEREFCMESVTGLGLLELAHAEVLSAQEALGRAEDAAHALAAAFAASRFEANTRNDSLEERAGEVDRKRGAADQQQGVAYDLLYLYQLRGAKFRVESADREETTARNAVNAAKEAVAAWEVAGQIAVKRKLLADLEANAREAAQERNRTAPQRRAHDEHAARLRTRLLALAAEHAEAAGQALDDQGEAERSAGEHKVKAERYRVEASEADQEGAGARAKLDTLAADIEAAVLAGSLPDATTDPSAHDAALGLRREALDATLKEVRARRQECPAIRQRLADRQTELLGEIAKLDIDRGRVAGERSTLEDRSAVLSADQRILDLTEATDDVPADIWAEADTLTRRLTDEIVGADVALVRQEAERMEDRRATDTQARTGRLPTTLDAERVRAILAGQGIASETGWTHLLSVMAEARLSELLDDPDLVRVGLGVVVATEQAEDAALALLEIDATTTALVGLYTAADASRAARATGSPAPAVTPVWTGLHRGLVDTAVAEAAISRIHARIAEHERERTALTTQRDRDRTLLTELTQFLADCPTGHLAGLEWRIADLDRALGELDQSVSEIRAKLDELEAAERADAELEADTTAALSEVAQRRARLATLIPKVAAADSWREALEEATRKSRRAIEQASHHESEREAASVRALAAATAANSANVAAKQRTAEAESVRFLDTAPEVDDDETVLLDSLRGTYEDAERAWAVQAADSVLAERERMIQAQLVDVNAALGEVNKIVVERADSLLLTRLGQTVADRAAALADARQTGSEAQTALGRAEAESKIRRSELKTITQRRLEPPRRALPVEPDDAEHADSLAAEQEKVGQTAVERRIAAERELAAIREQQDRLKARANTFLLLADGLPEAGERAAPAFEGDEAAARARRGAVARNVLDTRERYNEKVGARTRAVGDLRTIGSRFQTVATPAKDRLAHVPEEIVAEQAGALIRQLRLRAEMIEGELAGIAKDQAIVVDSLAHLVSSTLETLRKAERYSRVTTQLGGWSGKQVLRIGFAAPASEADLRTYVDRVIERRIEASVKAEGLPLLKDAVHEAAGPAGFRVKVLKPTLDVVSTTEDITRLGKWSGGEKLTVCVALYCTIAALRAANAGRRDRSGGVLLLDNPIGRASHGSLVGLQRAVAAAHRVQLVYTTGVKDPDAVSRFPTVIRLDNRPGRTRNRRYIVEQKNDDTGTRTVDGVRVAHAEQPPEASR